MTPTGPTSSLWFVRGLRFGCTQCGGCCTGSAGYVWVTRPEIEAIARHRDEPVDETLRSVRWVEGRYSLKERVGGDCVYFHPVRGCVIYPVRPVQCITWPFWPSNVRTPAFWDMAARRCPGMGRGKWYAPERILRMASRVDP